MSNFKVNCQICGTVNKEKFQPTICSVCRADLTNPVAETLLKKGNVSFFNGGQRGPFGEPGWYGDLILTNKRLFFHKKGALETQVTMGALGPLLSTLATGDIDRFDLLPSNIQSFSIEQSGKRGINDKFAIATDANTVFRFSVPAKEFSDWKMRIEYFMGSGNNNSQPIYTTPTAQNTEQPHYCMKCGNKFMQGATFCSKCGVQITTQNFSVPNIPPINYYTPAPSKQKNPSKAKRIWGIVLTSMGGIALISGISQVASGEYSGSIGPFIVGPGLFIGVGILLLVLAKRDKNR